jgi:hypothetical protein
MLEAGARAEGSWAFLLVVVVAVEWEAGCDCVAWEGAPGHRDEVDEEEEGLDRGELRPGGGEGEGAWSGGHVVLGRTSKADQKRLDM